MFTAVYYPHTAIRDENFLKHGLLYWDEIEFVSPFDGYDVLPRYPDSMMRELARFTKPRVPTEDEKKKAHAEIIDLLTGDLPSWLQVDRSSDADDYNLYYMFKDKLLPETWAELKRRNLVKAKRGHGDFDDYVSHTYLGLTMMAILARCCAGTLKHTITDQNDSYYALLKHLQFLSGESEGSSAPLDERSQQTFKRWLNTLGVTKSSAEGDARQTLVSVTLDVIDAKKLTIGDLLKLRNDKTKFAAELRQNYAQAVEKQVAQLSDPALSATDSKAVVDDFRRAMQQDLDRLYDELKWTAVKTVLSKEVAVAIAAPLAGSAALIASGAGSILGGALGAAALGKLAVEYRTSRKSVFAKHPMAFLYSGKGVRLY
jgi:hypothetical protein